MNRATSVGTLRLGSTRSYTCSMNSEPDSISRLMNPVSTPIATKALRQAEKAAAMGDLATPFEDESLTRDSRGRTEKDCPRPSSAPQQLMVFLLTLYLSSRHGRVIFAAAERKFPVRPWLKGPEIAFFGLGSEARRLPPR